MSGESHVFEDGMEMTAADVAWNSVVAQ